MNGTEEELKNLKDKVDKFSNQFKIYNDGLYIGKKIGKSKLNKFLTNIINGEINKNNAEASFLQINKDYELFLNNKASKDALQNTFKNYIKRKTKK